MLVCIILCEILLIFVCMDISVSVLMMFEKVGVFEENFYF